MIFDVINENKRILSEFDHERYPALAWLEKRTSVFDTLKLFMEHMLTYKWPVWPRDEGSDPSYFLFSQGHLLKWGQEQGYRRTPITLQGHYIFLIDTGLLKRVRATSDSQDPILREIWNQAVKNAAERHQGHRILAETLWSVDLFTDEVLAKADGIARKYNDHKIPLSHIRKNDIIRLHGQEIANKLYLDGRTISQEEQYVIAKINEVIQNSVEATGYASVQQVNRDVRAAIYRDHGYRFYPVEDLSAEAMAERDRVQPYTTALFRLMKGKTTLARYARCVYRPAKRNEKETYGIADRAWYFFREQA